MENNLEKLMEQQMRWQRLTAILLGALVAVLVAGCIYVGTVVQKMTVAVEKAEVFLEEATETLEILDVEGINQAFAEVDEFVNSMDGVVEKADSMVETIDSVTGKMEEVTKKFEPITEALENLKDKLSFF